jgi:hypothetical protein
VKLAKLSEIPDLIDDDSDDDEAPPKLIRSTIMPTKVKGMGPTWDSGASHTFLTMKWKDMCYNIKELLQPEDITLADNKTTVQATHRGTLDYYVGGLKIKLRNVYLVSGLPDSLVSQSHVLRCLPGYEYVVRQKKMYLRKNDSEYFIGAEVNNLYYLFRNDWNAPSTDSHRDRGTSMVASACNGNANLSHQDKDHTSGQSLSNAGSRQELRTLLASLSAAEWQLLHETLGHMSKEYISRSILSGSIGGIEGFLHSIKGTMSHVLYDECICCVLSKIVQRPITNSPNPAQYPLQCIGADVFELPVVSIRGSQWMMLVIDEYTRYTVVILIRDKSHAATALAKIILQWENHLSTVETKVHAERVRSDSGELMSTKFVEWLERRGMIHEPSPADVKEMNGLVERTIRTIKTISSAGLSRATIPPFFMCYSAEHASLIRNLMPHPKIKNTTPYLLFHGKTVKISALAPFGCQVTVNIPKERRKGSTKEQWQHGVSGIYLGTLGTSIPLI